MTWKKFFCGLTLILLTMTATVNAAPEESANAKLVKIEIDTYGSEQSGALLDRIGRLEKDYSGRNMVGNMNARIEAIYDIIYNNEAGPGVLAKINALEWNANRAVSSGGLGNRLTALENQIAGATNSGSFNERILTLAKASYGEEILPITLVQVPVGVLIKVETTIPVTSKTLQEGDIIPVRVVDDVFVNNSLVFARGLTGEGVVTRVVRAKHIFNNGKIETDFDKLKTIDGQVAATCVGTESQEAMNVESMARGLSLVGHTFSGKHKDIDEVLVRGKNIDLPAGVVLYIQTKVPLVVYGVRDNSVDGLRVDEQIPQEESSSLIEVTSPVEPTTPATSTTPSTSTTPATSTPTVEPTTPATSTPTVEPTTPSTSTPTVEPTTPSTSTPPPSTPPPASSNEPPPLYDDEEIIEIIDED